MSNIFIPQDLVRDVLSRLSVKSLLRFKCVSKSWYLMIDDPEFVKTHSKHMKRIAQDQDFDNGVRKLYSVDFNFREISNTKNTEEINYRSIMDDYKYMSRLIGSCNGLVCLVYLVRETIIFLLNPSTREILRLPICSKQYRTLRPYDNHAHGFGYDEVTDDYKVVRLVRYRDEYYRPTFSECFVYSLKSNEWRRLEDFAYGDDLMWQYGGVLVNGTLHWLLEDRSVLAFNLVTEGFKLLLPPKSLTKCPVLCLPDLILSGAAREMWVMENYETKDSLTKSILDLSTLIPTGYWDTVVISGFEEQTIQELKFIDDIVNVKECVYFESLVRLDAGGRKHGTALIDQSNRGQEDKESEGITSTEEEFGN